MTFRAATVSERPTDMQQRIPAVRILPMSDKQEGFVGKSIEQVQADCFLRDLPRVKGRYRYPSSGLNAEAGTVVLFQFKARIIASGIFVRDERYPKKRSGYAGVLHFEADSFRVFDPLDAAAMRSVWPAFKAFGHAKQTLNPLRYSALRKVLTHVKAPGK